MSFCAPAGKLCSVIDAVFHPETYKKGQEVNVYIHVHVHTLILAPKSLEDQSSATNPKYA